MTSIARSSVRNTEVGLVLLVGVESLILGRRGHVTRDGQIAQKPAHFHRPHLAGVALTMKEDVALYPLPVGGFGSDGIMLEAHDFAHLVQQFELGIRNKALQESDAFAFPI